MNVTFGPNGISFRKYLFPAASVFPAGSVGWEDVVAAHPDGAPPEIRLRSGEILFVDATLKDELRAAVIARGILSQRRVDVWELLLEPFLDTEFDSVHIEQTVSRLAACGISREQTERIRGRVRGRMLRYNAFHWEWAHLGLFDLLDAHLPLPPLRFLPWWRGRFRAVYSFAMEIAGRAPLLEERPDAAQRVAQILGPHD